tara:strand:+ start:534 stop:1052 length:519 start_codon:yes stop_codon:yes gene_type:complete
MKDELLQLINITWINNPNSSLSLDYITRFWSIDTQWMSISEAEELLKKLVENEWLSSEGLEILPRINIDSNLIEFGWSPKININEIPPYNDESPIKIQVQNNPPLVENNLTNPELSNIEKRLLRYISANSGILKDEVVRRCLRKKRALNQITIEFCLLLIAKEQGMDMHEFI